MLVTLAFGRWDPWQGWHTSLSRFGTYQLLQCHCRPKFMLRKKAKTEAMGREGRATGSKDSGARHQVEADSVQDSQQLKKGAITELTVQQNEGTTVTLKNDVATTEDRSELERKEHYMEWERKGNERG